MSARLSETFFDAFRQVRLSYDRVLDRLSRCAVSIMNLTVRLLQLFCVTLLYFSAVKSAYIPRESDGDTHVVPFTDVYNKSMCRPREMLVDVQQEYPEDIEHIFIPSCVVLMRCAGCCNDEMLECTPTATHNITMEVQKLKPMRIRRNYPMSFTEHTECECRIKKNIIQEKTENTPTPTLNLSGAIGRAAQTLLAGSEREVFLPDKLHPPPILVTLTRIKENPRKEKVKKEGERKSVTYCRTCTAKRIA
ncbi:vascular endothelial growth factor Ab isoform X3 [Trichomycterus rosablanca]|uniref:vascular endothelial growth factor Ab isoform X3 n=1 Tax=Trichomycterus rosablanca TaxID=2290929 RepID=UPI002F351E74